MEFYQVKRILICRMGAIGDAITALPSLHLVNRRFPNAHKALLSDRIFNQKTISIFSILEAADLVNVNIEYPCKPLTWKALVIFIEKIRSFNPEVVIYLEGPKNWLKILRDILFFKLCNFPRRVKIFGFKYLPFTNVYRFDKNTGLYEYEANRLLRSIVRVGVLDINDNAYWSLRLKQNEMDKVCHLSPIISSRVRYIVCSIGTKIPLNHWGMDKWTKLFTILGDQYCDLGLLLIGAACEFNEHECLAKLWKGPVENWCGKISLQETLCLVKEAVFFIGHNSGPMHICASQGVPCIAIFSGRDLPGVWFPFGNCHKIIYHRTDCCGCQLFHCLKYQAKCIQSIGVDEVLQAINEVGLDVLRR